jgi:hypothetical protein
MPITTRSKAAAAEEAPPPKVAAVAGMAVSEVRRAMDAARTQWREASPLAISAPLCACGDETLTLQGFCTRFVLGQHKKRKRAAVAS